MENMKLSYKRRLVLEPMHSIDHLAQLCFKFDALESSLYYTGGHSRPMINQVVVGEDDVEEESEDNNVEQVCALKNRVDEPSRIMGARDGQPRKFGKEARDSKLPMIC